MPRHEGFFREHGHLLRDRLLYLPNPTFGNPAWADAELRVLVVRLSSFRDVDRSSTHLVLAREIRRGLERAFVDLAFLPVPDDRALLERHGVPLLAGTQSHRTIEEFDLVLVSTSCLPELVNLPFLLARSHVPVWSRDRDEEWPIIVLGGSNAAAAHSTVTESGDAMADALFFGEGEDAVGALAAACRDTRGRPKPDRLEAMARAVDGLWPAGDLSRPVRRASAPAGALERQGDGVVPLLPGAENGTARLEITRGCPSRCAFCFEGRDRGRFRAGDEAGLLAAARSLKAATGATTLEVASLNFNTHPRIAGLLEGFHRTFALVNPMSQRVDILARTPGLVDLELAADKRSFTLGVEGISPSMRAFLGKRLDDADLWRCLDLLARRGVRELKLFFILTGRENEPDLADFAGFVKELRRRGSRAEAQPRTIFSFGLLVRMPFTPLAFDPVPLDEAAWRRISGRLKSACETNGFEFRVAMGWTDWIFSQLAALGGYRVHGLLETLADRGCVYDAELARPAQPLIEE
ncbi:MAG: radical SAM protein [Spirochaetes bacterium]|nr:radical SAM protein [Spirochaetota bacterium]